MFRRLRLTSKFSGFTITEVMIVLAVATLIMAVIFTAVPQLERTQRDTTRKNLAGRLLSSVETFAANSQGTYPFSGIGGTGSAPPAAWTDCSTVVSSSSTYTCYDWYNNSLSGGKVTLTDPSSAANVTIRYSTQTTNPSGTITPGDIYLGVGDQCSGANLSAGSAPGTSSSKQFALLTAIEGSGKWTCIDNK